MLACITWFGLGLCGALVYLLTSIHCMYMGESITMGDFLLMAVIIIMGPPAFIIIGFLCILAAIPNNEKLNRFLDKTVIKGK